ncbi:MAG TPA: S8 family serine peptidase [Steroidobacteraceae bacterium]|nr:S8 family serine peptidase [Steroidobacteraceae bacterium]
MKFTPLSMRAIALGIGTMLGAATGSGWAAEKLQGAALDTAQAETEVFVRLSTPSVAELNAASIKATGRMASSDAQKRHAARIDAEQAAFRGHLASYNARELSRQRVGANGLRVKVPADQINALQALPGVRSVGRVETHVIDNAESVDWIGALDVHADLRLRGDGVTIGIIDTGIDYTHANFGGVGTVAEYTKNDKNRIEKRTFPTAKVVGGFDFAGPTYDANDPKSEPSPDPDPLDGNGHGSHVAGSAAGFGVPGRIGAGVAPDAKLYALKVFSDGGGSTNVTSLAIEWAMDPNADGDMSDHLDVINMSLGSSFGEPNDPSAISTENAVDVGIIVATSAGNSGTLPYVTGAPGVAPSAISTAANVPGLKSWATLNVTAPAAIAGTKFNEEGTSPARVSSVAPFSDTVVEAAPLNGCAPLTNAAAVSGNIVLIQRGVCTFAVKAGNALAAGARAMLVFNNAAGDPIVMGGITAAIPGVMIGLTDGNAVNAQATTAADSPVQAAFGFGLDPFKDDRTAVFSSRGPGSGGSGFKPDLAAPGVSIISTGAGTGNGPAPNQGTSMSSPHVAGAAALLRQLHPNLAPSAIKALLQNSTVDGQGDISLTRQGVGSMRVDRAVELTSYASPGGVSFGRVNPNAPTTVTRTVSLNNLATGPRTFNVTHVARSTYQGVTVSCPSAVTLGSGGEDVDLTLAFDPSVSAAAGRFDNPVGSQTQVEGWCVFDDGVDSLRVGYIGVVDAASGFTVTPSAGGGVDVTNAGPARGFADGFTLIGSGGVGAENTYGSITRLGARRNTVVSGGVSIPVVELGIALDERYEHVSNLSVDLFLNEGIIPGHKERPVQLVARDFTALDPVNGVLGTYVTAQFSGKNPGLLDWVVSRWDFNDRVLILPYTLAAGGGFVPDRFTYRLVVSDRQGNTDVQEGVIDLTNLIAAPPTTIGLAGGGSAHVNVTSGTGHQMLWLFPNNVEGEQEALVTVP